MKKFLLALFLFTSIVQTFAQNKEHLSGFYVLSLTYKFDKKWYAYAETQTRSIAEFNTLDYYEIKGGTGYTFNSLNQSFVGLGRYATYKNEKINREEFRIWLQHTFSKNISRVKFENRIRLEKRFFYTPLTNTNTNTERYRNRLNVIIPLNNVKVQEKTFFVNAYDEIFLQPESNEKTISRNRMYIGGGYQINKKIGTSIGYLLQRDFSVKANTNSNFLFCSLNFTIDNSKKVVETPVPTQAPD